MHARPVRSSFARAEAERRKFFAKGRAESSALSLFLRPSPPFDLLRSFFCCTPSPVNFYVPAVAPFTTLFRRRRRFSAAPSLSPSFASSPPRNPTLATSTTQQLENKVVHRTTSQLLHSLLQPLIPPLRSTLATSKRLQLSSFPSHSLISPSWHPTA